MPSGFGERLLQELRTGAPPHTRIRINAPSERLHATYVGGSILASLATFKNMFVTKQEFEERGEGAIRRTMM